MDRVFLLPALLAFAAVAFGTIAVVLVIDTISAARRRRDILKRLQPVEGGPADPLSDLLVRDVDEKARGRIAAALGRMPRVRDVSFLIQQSGTEWTVARYVLLTVGAGIAFGAALLFLTLNPLIGALGAVIGALLPDFYLRFRAKRRLGRFEEQFPEAMDLLGRAIRAGHPLSAGLRMVADEMPDPMSMEFRQVFEEQRFGLPFDDALLSMADRVDLVDVRIFITAVLIQREVGGNLAEILDKIATTIRGRFTLKRQLRVYTAQGRISGYALVGLPIMTGVALYFIDKEYVSMLWTESVGRLMVGVVLVMWFIGLLWIRRIINIEI
jgi:tight adherence protein B